MIFHNYLFTLKRIVSCWSEFSIYPTGQSKFHFLICHKIFWAYLRQGLFRKEFHIAFNLMNTKFPTPVYLPYLHMRKVQKVYFNKEHYVDELLEKCNFSLFESKLTHNKTIYYFRNRRN